MTTGLPLADPVNLNTVTPRTLRLRLVAGLKQFDISGKNIPPASLASAHVARYRVIKLSENAAGTTMYINGQQFNPAKSIFSTPAVLGTTEQWAFINETGEIHPFHVHTDHFQVISINGLPQPYTGEQDLVPLPRKEHGIPGVVVIRIHFSDFVGKVMFHCHIAAHEDAGMMSFINVIAH